MEAQWKDCEPCMGRGVILSSQDYWFRCRKCMGKGKLDWIEVMFKPSQDIPSDYELFLRTKKFKKASRWGFRDFQGIYRI